MSRIKLRGSEHELREALLLFTLDWFTKFQFETWLNTISTLHVKNEKNKAFVHPSSHSWFLGSQPVLWTTHLVTHVRLELKLGRRAEGCGEHLHEPLPVAPRVQAVHGVLDDVQTLVARRLQVVLGRQVGPEGPVQTGVVAQVAALAGRGRRVRKFAAPTTKCSWKGLTIDQSQRKKKKKCPAGVRPHKQADWRSDLLVLF